MEILESLKPPKLSIPAKPRFYKKISVFLLHGFNINSSSLSKADLKLNENKEFLNGLVIKVLKMVISTVSVSCVCVFQMEMEEP